MLKNRMSEHQPPSAGFPGSEARQRPVQGHWHLERGTPCLAGLALLLSLLLSGSTLCGPKPHVLQVKSDQKTQEISIACIVPLLRAACGSTKDSSSRLLRSLLGSIPRLITSQRQRLPLSCVCKFERPNAALRASTSGGAGLKRHQDGAVILRRRLLATKPTSLSCEISMSA